SRGVSSSIAPTASASSDWYLQHHMSGPQGLHGAFPLRFRGDATGDLYVGTAESTCHLVIARSSGQHSRLFVVRADPANRVQQFGERFTAESRMLHECHQGPRTLVI